MNSLVNQMKEDASSTALDSMGKIGAVANDVADTQKEINNLEEQLKTKKDYKKTFVRKCFTWSFYRSRSIRIKTSRG